MPLNPLERRQELDQAKPPAPIPSGDYDAELVKITLSGTMNLHIDVKVPDETISGGFRRYRVICPLSTVHFMREA